MVAGPSNTKSPRIENSVLEILRTTLKEEITSEIKGLIIESQRELLKLLKPKTGENTRGENEIILEVNSRSFHTPTRSVRINSTQNNDSDASRNSSHAFL